MHLQSKQVYTATECIGPTPKSAPRQKAAAEASAQVTRAQKTGIENPLT